ncbi:MAG TPA: hypothetical protein VFE50_08765 [Cyclobacteriaceae bacterium]|nr:hypothetical protein [Cyclobacteriaceae bacterium]
MRVELTHEEKQATLDAIDRFRTNDPKLLKLYEIEFVLTGAISDLNDNDLIDFLNANSIEYAELRQNGVDTLVIVRMRLDADRLIMIESYLKFFANNHALVYDGWGAFE